MTLQEFISKWLGKKADFDGAYGGQCVDLARFYWKEVCGISQPKGVSGAADFWTNFDTDANLKNNHTKMAYYSGSIPQAGDVMIWNKNAGGGFGHIAIFIEGTVNQFKSFDQNWPTLSECTITNHSYQNVLGWFRPNKKEINMDITNLLTKYNVKSIEELDAKIYEHCGKTWGGENDGGFLGAARKELKKAQDDLIISKKELDVCLAKPPVIVEKPIYTAPTDEWVANGKTVETIEGNVKTIINFKLKG